MMAARQVPQDWYRKCSRSKPGQFYWANANLKLTFWSIDEVLAFEDRLKGRQDTNLTPNDSKQNSLNSIKQVTESLKAPEKIPVAQKTPNWVQKSVPPVKYELKSTSTGAYGSKAVFDKLIDKAVNKCASDSKGSDSTGPVHHKEHQFKQLCQSSADSFSLHDGSPLKRGSPHANKFIAESSRPKHLSGKASRTKGSPAHLKGSSSHNNNSPSLPHDQQAVDRKRKNDLTLLTTLSHQSPSTLTASGVAKKQALLPTVQLEKPLHNRLLLPTPVVSKPVAVIPPATQSNKTNRDKTPHQKDSYYDGSGWRKNTLLPTTPSIPRKSNPTSATKKEKATPPRATRSTANQVESNKSSSTNAETTTAAKMTTPKGRKAKRRYRNSSTPVRENVDTAAIIPATTDGQSMLNLEPYEDDQPEISNERLNRILNYSLVTDVEMADMDSIEQVANVPESDSVESKHDITDISPTESSSQSHASNKIGLVFVFDTCSMGLFEFVVKICHRATPISFKSSDDVWRTYMLSGVRIPYQVLREAEWIKKNKNNRKDEATVKNFRRYVDAMQSQPYDSIHYGIQRKSEHDKPYKNFSIDEDDDHIIKYCLILKDKDPNWRIVLITDDKNMRNKARSCEMESMSCDMIKQRIKILRSPTASALFGSQKPLPNSTTVARLSPVNPSTSKVEPMIMSQEMVKELPSDLNRDKCSSIPQPVSNQPKSEADTIRDLTQAFEAEILPVFSLLVETEMKAAFGDIWREIVILKPPWTSAIQLFTCLKRHWVSVFGMKLDRDLEHTAASLNEFFTSHCSLGDKDRLIHAVIQTGELIKNVGSLGEPYNGQCSSTLTKLASLMRILQGVSQDTTATEEIDRPCTPPMMTTDSHLTEEQLQIVCQTLGKIFSVLYQAEPTNEDQRKELLTATSALGNAYAKIMNRCDEQSLNEFASVLSVIAQRANLEASLELSVLFEFVAGQRNIMAEGLMQLEKFYSQLVSSMQP